MAKVGVINVSDRASRGEYEDIPGKEAVRLLREFLITEVSFEYAVVPDEQKLISETLCSFCDEKQCDLVLTTGGTGPAPRDVTPEATEAVIEKLLPGFGEAMRMVSLPKVPTAILSRQIAGIRGRSLIVNLPGKPRAISECLEIIFPAIPYCLDLIGASRIETKPELMKSFRPKSG